MNRIGPLLACGIGDAYGVGHEYAPRAVVEAENNLSGYRRHEKHKSIVPGCYSDDTQMSIAVAELLLAEDTSEWTHFMVADAFVKAFVRDPRTGYSGTFYDVLTSMAEFPDVLSMSSGTAGFLATVRPHSPKSGGAMRASPIGLLTHPRQVVNTAMMQASVTHATWEGMIAAAAAALMTHFCWHDLGPKTEIPAFLERWAPGPDWTVPWSGKVGARGLEAVKAALDALISHSTTSQVLRACIAYTGDVDTVAAIAMPAAALCRTVEQDLPQVLFDGLENGTYGRDYLIGLDARILVKFPSSAGIVSVPVEDVSVIGTAPPTVNDDDDVLGFLFGKDEA